MTAQHSLIISPSKKGKPTARARKRLADAPPIDSTITNLAHDGRGVAVYETDNESHNPDKAGKKIFVSFALPNETVSVKVTSSKKTFEEGDAKAIISNPHPQRQTPPCPHFTVCGGCSLQHWDADGQIAFKRNAQTMHIVHRFGQLDV